MIQSKMIKLKKYLFLISIIFFVLTLSNLIYFYIYNDSKLIPIKWWTVSEWLIGNFPSLNPLKPLSWNNKYIVWLLYRNLLKFDLKENKIVWDLANCDISNLLHVECYLKDNIYWSDWQPITTEDVIATYEILKNTWVNKVISSLLEETEIKKENNTITFNNTKKDINFLNIFFQPILPKETIDSLSQDIIFWNFPTNWQIYSWDFKIWSISSDMTLWITKIFLDTNTPYYEWNIAKLVINMFPNINSLLQNKETINIFNDDDNIIWDSIPRLENHKYILPQYFSLFINQNKIKDQNLRNYILEKINTDNLIKILWESKFEIVKNPYLTQTSTDSEVANKNFEKIIADLWYVKKSKIIENKLPGIIKTSSWTSTSTWMVKDSTWTTTPETKIEIKAETKVEISDSELSIDKFQKDSELIVKPTYVDKFNFITKDDVLLEWKAWANVSEVYVNDYKLTSFTKWDSMFYYRLKESYWTIKAWENVYKIYFVINWEKILKEELNFLFYRNKATLETETKKYIRKLYEQEAKQKAGEEENDTQTISQEQQKQTELKQQEEEKTKLEALKNNQELQKLNDLDEKFYYNDKLEKFTLKLYYLSNQKDLEDTANFIKNSLLEIWINVETVSFNITDIKSILDDKDKYDMIITWVNLWFFDYNIFPYFHSSQAKNWYNFSNIKKTSLDILLEDLKSWLKNPEEIEKTKEKILEILKKEQIVKTLYTPKLNLLIDKNIKNINIPEKLVNKSSRKDIFSTLNIKEEKIINFENKWVWDFFNFLKKKLNE